MQATDNKPLTQHRRLWTAAVVLMVTSAGAVAVAQDSAPVRDRERRIQKRVRSWLEIKRQNVVMQGRDYSCGAAALATLLRYYWEDPVTETELLLKLDDLLTREEVVDRIENGLTLTDLRKLAVKSGYLASIGRLELDKLRESKVPLVVGITVDDYRHFVVYRGIEGGDVYLADPARGNIRTPIEDFRRQWQENAVLAVAKRGAKPKDSSPLSIRDAERPTRINDQLIRRTFLPTPRFFPAKLR